MAIPYNQRDHSHCWAQGKEPACGIPLEKHTQCCLCPVVPTKVEKCCLKCVTNLNSIYSCRNNKCKCHTKPEQLSEEVKRLESHECKEDLNGFCYTCGRCMLGDFEPEPHSSWEEEFEFIFGLENTVIKDFIRTLLTQAKADSYKEGVNEEFRNWLPKMNSAYEQGVMDGKESERNRIAEVIRGMMQEGKTEFDIGSEFSTPRDIRRSGYNSALKDILAAIAPEVSRDEQ